MVGLNITMVQLRLNQCSQVGVLMDFLARTNISLFRLLMTRRISYHDNKELVTMFVFPQNVKEWESEEVERKLASPRRRSQKLQLEVRC